MTIGASHSAKPKPNKIGRGQVAGIRLKGYTIRNTISYYEDNSGSETSESQIASEEEVESEHLVNQEISSSPNKSVSNNIRSEHWQKLTHMVDFLKEDRIKDIKGKSITLSQEEDISHTIPESDAIHQTNDDSKDKRKTSKHFENLTKIARLLQETETENTKDKAIYLSESDTDKVYLISDDNKGKRKIDETSEEDISHTIPESDSIHKTNATIKRKRKTSEHFENLTKRVKFLQEKRTENTKGKAIYLSESDTDIDKTSEEDISHTIPESHAIHKTNEDRKAKIKASQGNFAPLKPIALNTERKETDLRYIIYPIKIYAGNIFHNFSTHAEFSKYTRNKGNYFSINTTTYNGVFGQSGQDVLTLPMMIKVWYHYQNKEREKHKLKKITTYNPETIIEDIKSIIKEMTDDIDNIFKTNQDMISRTLTEVSDDKSLEVDDPFLFHLIDKLQTIHKHIALCNSADARRQKRTFNPTNEEFEQLKYSHHNPKALPTDLNHVVYPIKIYSNNAPHNFDNITMFNSYVSKTPEDPLHLPQETYNRLLAKKYTLGLKNMVKLWCHYQNAEREKQKIPKITTYNPKTIIKDIKFIIEEMHKAFKKKLNINTERNKIILKEFAQTDFLSKKEYPIKDILETLQKIRGSKKCDK